MFAIAISTKKFYDSELAASEAAKSFINNNHGYMVMKDKSEGEIRRIASRIWLYYGLESRVFEI